MASNDDLSSLTSMPSSFELEQQRTMCDKAMELVNQGVVMQSNGQHAMAESSLMEAMELMKEALEIQYNTVQEEEVAGRLNKKLRRYVKMIQSQRRKQQGNKNGPRMTPNVNLVDMDNSDSTFEPVLHLLERSGVYGDILERLRGIFGFQLHNVRNQKEHLVLLISNYRYQAEVAMRAKKLKKNRSEPEDGQAEAVYTTKGVENFHKKLFTNYAKWCKYVKQKTRYSKDPLADIALFFLIWGEAGNFRQTPELLCFLYHQMAKVAVSDSSNGMNLPPGDFLSRVIRPLYVELKKENDKQTVRGARAPHSEIRNYDDFNEFFWKTKCLKYDMYTICQAAATVDKRGRPKILKKTYKEKRSWFQAILSFRRVFLFTAAMFLATLGFAINMTLLCPDTPIMYGADLKEISAFGKKYFADYSELQQSVGDTGEDPDENDAQCLPAKLATCLGVSMYTPGYTFDKIPRDFRELILEVPFTKCVSLRSGRCGCYSALIKSCFSATGVAEKYVDPNEEKGIERYPKVKFNQERCIPDWKEAVVNIIESDARGALNCEICSFSISDVISNLAFVDFCMEFINFGRSDFGPLVFAGGVAIVALNFLFEFKNRVCSGLGIGYVGRSMHVPFGAYIRYSCFWILLFIVKLLFDYEFMIKSLVETTLFIWVADPEEYLQYSNFMIQQSFHNITYILVLWIPAFIVFMYDAQIFYAILSVIFGSVKGFNLRIGEVRSFRILRLTFKTIPEMFNKKMVANITEGAAKKSKKSKKKSKNEVPMPVRRFERISYSEGEKPLTIKTQQYSSILEFGEDGTTYSEMSSPRDRAANNSNLDAMSGMSGAAFERTISFAMAWNRCLKSLREADVVSDRELNVLSYLIDSKHGDRRMLYPPAFLTAGKLDESIDIVSECAALSEKFDIGKKKNSKTLQKIESSMRERLLKDDLRVQAVLGSYKFSSMVLRRLLGEEHREMDDVFGFIEEVVQQRQVLRSLNFSNLYQARASCAELMKAILEVPKNATANSIKFQRSLYNVIDNVEGVMAAFKQILSRQENLVQMLNDTPLKSNSFFFPGDAQQYASTQLLSIINDQTAMDIVSRAYQLLTVDNFDAEPRSEEGRRRLRFFVNSLFMDMPGAQPVRHMHSLSIATPYYNEIVLYSIKDLTTQNDDSSKLIYYLQTVYRFEWENFLERLNVKNTVNALNKYPEQVRLWASYRGQTLARTVRGMMYNEEAIRFLHWLEIGQNEPMHLAGCVCNRCKKLDAMVTLKFSYVCTCQIYGKQKDEQRQQAQDIDYLLVKHPNFRVAYVDGPKKVKDGPPKFFSVLIRGMGKSIAEVYRIELPGNPIVGEGKPENQNHAIIFSRGEMLQCVDMNQDGYYEECLKMPNLLATADRHSSKHPLTIIGFREHVFTGGVSNLASFMSIQELSFVSLGQRMLAQFHVRQHYGHPDIFDKMFAITTGGTAKASKGINLSEDIFAGFNTTLRGGYVSHEEFIQVGKGRDVGMQQLAIFEAKLSSGAGESVISRDVMRMANRLDFFRLQSWFYGNLGWYFTQSMTVFAIYVFIYGKIYQGLSGMDSYFLEHGGLGIGGTLNTSWALQMGFLLIIPVIAVVGVERGFRHGIAYLFWNVLTLGPIFFTFQMGTRMHYFDRSLIHGGGRYRATGRGFTIKHEKFAELFRFYAHSHFARGVELAFLLFIYGAYATLSWCNCSWKIDREFYSDIEPTAIEWKRRCYDNHFQACVLPTSQNYSIITFSLWIIAATWMWAPFFFNPSGLDWDKIIEDYNDWQNWLRTKNDSSESWYGWWTKEHEYLEHSTGWAKFSVFLRKSRFFVLAIGIYLNMVYHVYYDDRNLLIENNQVPYILFGTIFVVLIVLTCCGYIVSRMFKKMSRQQRKLRKIKFYFFFTLFILLLASLSTVDLGNLAECIVILLLVTYWIMQLTIIRQRHHHIVIRALARSYDRIIGWVVFGPIMVVAMFLPFLSSFQQRVMFNNAFISGLEVSKLFSHDAAPQHTKPLSKKKKSSFKSRDD